MKVSYNLESPFQMKMYTLVNMAQVIFAPNAKNLTSAMMTLWSILNKRVPPMSTYSLASRRQMPSRPSKPLKVPPNLVPVKVEH